ncbi:MAG: hypothetical protein QOJ46_2358 [bacterium]|jgi:hypothetical protein
MRDIFKGFLVLRLAAFVVLLIVVGLVLGISALSRGSDIAGAAILATVVVLTAAIGSLVAHRVSRRPR